MAWFAKGSDLERLIRDANRQGVPLGAVLSGSRRRPDGTEVSWQFTDPRTPVGDGIVPFFIDWGQSPHPARSAAQGASLVGLRAEHPDSAGVARLLHQLGLELPVRSAERPALIAIIDCPRGRVELR